MALFNIDFYKADHRSQYPEGTEMVYSNFTPRSSRLAPVLSKFYDEKVVFFGLQAFIKEYLIKEWNETFFNINKDKAVTSYKRRMDTSLGQGAVDVEHIGKLHDLGFLPIEIKALPEGSRVNIKVPMLTVKNTLPEFFWLTNYLETVLSADLWKPCTTATIAYEYRKIMEYYAELTGANKDGIMFQCHDFSFRGMSGRHDARISGMGHLLSFCGTDTVPAIGGLEDLYNADAELELIGASVPASEHSVMCMGTQEGEIETFRRFITELYPSGIVSIVSDTWDFWKVLTEFTVELKDEILNRTPNALGMAKTVFRPDSGDPVKIITGYFPDELVEHDGKFYEKLAYPIEHGRELSEAEIKGAVETLYDIFGGTETELGYKTLHERVGLIYGDSITLERADTILSRLGAKGFSSDNIVFGVGSYTYQYVTRDSFGFAMKATAGEVKGELREIFKDPKTDKGTKKSAKGLLRVEKEGNDFVLYDQQAYEQEAQGELNTVFVNGYLSEEHTLQEIRDRLLNS